MLTITLEPADVVLRRSLDAAKRWFEQIGVVLAERDDDPVALVAPSVIVPEYNVVLYPRPQNFEPELARIECVEPFQFDERMFDEVPQP